MKFKVLIAMTFGVAAAPGLVRGQLLPRERFATLPNATSLHAQVYYTAQPRHALVPLPMITLRSNPSEGWYASMEFSTLERNYNTGAGYAPRRHHYYTWYQLEKVMTMNGPGLVAGLSGTVSLLTLSDRNTNTRCADAWRVDVSLRFRNDAAISFAYTERRDSLSDAFVLREQQFPEKAYRLSDNTIRLTIPLPTRAIWNTELHWGQYYDHILRTGKFAVTTVGSRKVNIDTSLEYVRITGVGRVSGFVLRKSTNYRYRPCLNGGLGFVKTSIHGYTAVLVSATYTKGPHTIKCGYRKLFDRTWCSITSDNIYFASDVLFQYRYAM